MGQPYSHRELHVDTTAQYDAVRAYLKELDISSAVWVGLIRSNPDGDFTWTDYRGLSGDGYWSSAPDARAAPLCAAADPAADYRWEARACGGPTVASFICELPVPQWALGNEGCMVRALPALTILYLPESAAVQLTADCGLAGVKRVQCTGNVKREDLLKDLSCAEEEEITTTPGLTSSSNTWPVTTDVVFTDQDTTSEVTTEENATTEHEDDINQSSTIVASSTAHEINHVPGYKPPTKLLNLNKFNRINIDKTLDLGFNHNNNLQSNYIPKIANGDNYLTNEELEKIEDEKHMQHKMLHEEIARLGNLENIFTQPTDHFVPPLVMAKAKISDDMTVLSLREKHAQQMAEQHYSRQGMQYEQNEHAHQIIVKTTTEDPKTINKEKLATKSIDEYKKDKIKTIRPKKYNEKYYDPKSKVQKEIEIKPTPQQKIPETTTAQAQIIVTQKETSSPSTLADKSDDDSGIDLTVLIKDDPDVNIEKTYYTNYTGDVSKLEVIKNITLNNETEVKLVDVEATEEIKKEIPTKKFDETTKNITLNNEVVKITIISEGHTTTTAPTVFEITTRVPMIQENTPSSTVAIANDEPVHSVPSKTEELVSNHYNMDTTQNYFETEPVANVSGDTVIPNMKTGTPVVNEPSTSEAPTTTHEIPTVSTTVVNITNADKLKETPTASVFTSTHEYKMETYSEENHDDFGLNANSSETIDDFQSPLLSGANEPVHRPNRSRRPQQPNRNKFNPFRILG
ncbi:unnamed protein product [Chrysodeixis includens]|uniref:C-type lectin domain-containing protein n=1 Tax=Chrysodeixis includens TaxID=689277 RepID=A0A9N8KQC0_CHRIL|nr:unnamed protein product [Chrysodeixis includens]